jgi:folate-dependent phosphoribosylglycinamide formyltransferase PurN
LVSAKSVVVLSPSRYSLYTLAVLEGLARKGVEVRGVGLRRIADPKRLWHEAKRDGARLVRKIRDKLLLRRLKFRRESTASRETINSFLARNNIQLRSVPAYCSRNDIVYRYCADFNDPTFVEWVKASGADLIVFTGGGLIRRPLLDILPLGVVNCHMGILPKYRGMDLPEWAVLVGESSQIGCTVHLMDEGVDTGPVLALSHVPIEGAKTIREVRDRIEFRMCTFIVDIVGQYLSGRVAPRPQSMGDGKQWFIMTERLRVIAERRLHEEGNLTAARAAR